MRAFVSHLARIVGGLLATILVALVLLAAAETAAWTFFAVSWAPAAEIQGVLMVWFGLLGAVYALHHRVHLGVEVVTRRLPAAWQTAIARGVAALVAVFGGLLAVYGFQLANRVTNTLPATGLSASVQYFPAVVSGALLAVFAVVEMVHGPAPVSQGEADD